MGRRPLRILLLAAGLAVPGTGRAEDGPAPDAAASSAAASSAAASSAAESTTTGSSDHAPPPVALPPSTEAGRLERAVRAYQAGEHDLALTQLLTLLRDDPADDAVRRQAQVYIGEIFFVQGNRDAAREAFSLVLQDAPDHVMDPFKHPPDVCAFFELVRESDSWRPVAPVQPPPVVQAQPAPRPSPWLPLGVAQYRQERVGPGVLMSLGQGVSCALTVGLGTWLLLDRRYGSRNEAGIDEETGQRLWTYETLQSRRTAQWVSTGACYGTYAIGVTDAWLAERRYQNRQAVAASRGPALSLALHGRF